MSFNITSKKYEDESFDISNGGWSNMVDSLKIVAPDLMAKIKYLYTNDGDGLNEEDSILLAHRIEEGIIMGKIKTPNNWSKDFIQFLKECGGFELW